MSRPRKTDREIWLDEFAGWPFDQQAIALELVAFIHRQSMRRVKKTPDKEANGQQESLPGTAEK